MGSRRLMNRSLSGDGRYYGANDFTSQNSRSGCRSYLNSVRHESSYSGNRFSQSKPSRSTLSSVMAQLTEETQPTFDSTLKSKAVSEASNVKFICMVSGHPTPEVTWYKDDVQLDRYCSLPKYEILRDGKNHTLHIYNCTLEDAAIYQASAQNSRGIVSCSGVLEVGTMNEYKIHQNYFAKLKQRNENRRREQEEPRKTDKENVPEVLRMSSPERTQRKRRSPMEANPSFGASSSSEEKEELNAVSQTSAVEDRLGSPVPESESAPVHSLSEAEMITDRDKGSQGLTYIHDTVHMASTKQTAKDHYAKKKLKISTAAADRSKENSQTKSEEVTEMEMRDEMRGTCTEKMEVQKTKVIKNKVDIKYDTKQTEKQSVKASKSAAELKRTQAAQKTIVTQRRPASNVAMVTQTNVVKDTKQTDSSDKQKNVDKSVSHINLNAQTTINVLNHKTENCNPSSPDNKLMDLDDNKTKPAAGACVRILPHSCGVGDVNADTGDRNVSTHSPRASAGGDTHIEPMESAICESIPSSERKVVMELNQQPPLTRDVTSCVTDSELESHHLASQGEKNRAQDQSMTLTINSTFESTQQGDKKSSVHVSHPLQDGQVTTAMNSSLGKNTFTKMSEKDHTDGNLMIKTASDKPEGKIKSVATSLIGTEVMKISVDKNKECISENVQVQKNISKEKSTASTMHSVNIVTEFVQIGNLTSMSNADVLQSRTANESSIAKALLNHSKDLTFQKDEHVAKDNVSKMDIQEQGSSNLSTSEVPKATHYQKETFSAKMDQHSSTSNTSTIAARDNDPTSSHFDRSTFLSQHSKTLASKFTIPAIYVTDVDSTSPNIKTENIYLSPISNSESVPSCTESNVSIGNTVSQTGHTSDHTDNTTKTAATTKSEGLSDVHVSLHSQSSEVNPPQQTPQNQEKFTHIQGLKNVASDITGPNEKGMSHCHAEKSTKANESDKCLTSLAKTDPNPKPETDSFIRQLKSAAIDLEKSDQNSTSVVLNGATPHKDSKGRNNNWQAQTEVIQGESVLPHRNNNITPFSPSSEVTTIKTTDAQTPSLISQPASSLHSVSDPPSLEKHSPGLTRKSITADQAKPKGNDNIKTKPSQRENQFKVPQVIRKIRPEVFDASGHLKLWCQFYNIVSDSTIRWYKDDVELAEIKRSAGDETQVCLAIVQMYKRDCGVYKCVITNEYGQDSTEYLLITEILSNMFPREEHQEVGEEIEMTPLIFSKGLADAGCWGSKFYGRVTTEEAMVGSGCEHKTRRLRVIYGLDPVFESGSSCFMKVRSPIAYESREETVLAEKNLQITKQDCRIQNMAREYLKIFATETREIESFGSALEIIPLYFMYRPASTVPYATVEAELKGVYLRYCGLDQTGSLIFNNKSDVAQKCSSLQHWIYQWTNGNVLFSRLEGVDTILTNIGVVTKSQGYQGFPCDANPKIFEQFQTQHQCNYFCGLLNLKPPKVPEILQTARYRGSSSPQTQRKGSKSPKVSRRPNPQTST